MTRRAFLLICQPEVCMYIKFLLLWRSLFSCILCVNAGSQKDKLFSFFFFLWRYSPLWTLSCRTIPLHLSLSITSSLHLHTPSTWRSLSTSSLHPFLGIPLHFVPSSSWAKIFLCILSSSILSRWPSQRTLCPFIHFTIFSPLTHLF
jgi:hypothetical protein